MECPVCRECKRVGIAAVKVELEAAVACEGMMLVQAVQISAATTAKALVQVSVTVSVAGQQVLPHAAVAQLWSNRVCRVPHTASTQLWSNRGCRVCVLLELVRGLMILRSWAAF